jgi:hypothetical protein
MYHFNSSRRQIRVLLGTTLISLAGVAGGGAFGATTTITFAPQSGANGDPFVSDVESGFTTVPTTAGNWFQGQLYGNPVPSIYDGPTFNASVASIQITDGGGLFNFNSLDESSNNGPSDYSISGLKGGITQFLEAGTFAGTFGPYVFSTYSSSAADSATPIDTLDVTITPRGATSVNLDNIVLGTSVPEPASAGILLGGGALGLLRRRRAR